MTLKPPRPPAGIPLDAVAIAALTVLAAVLRLVYADWMPLDVAEAAQSLPAWQAAHGVAVDGLPGAMLLFHKQRALFWLGLDGDGWARFAPAMAGIALVPLAALLRPGLGRAAALAAAVLFAVDPLWTFYGRQASPATMSSLLVVATMAGWMRGGRRARDLVAILTALALTSGGVAYTAVLALFVTVVIRRIAGPLPAAGSGASGLAATDEDGPEAADGAAMEIDTGRKSSDDGRDSVLASSSRHLGRWLAVFAITLVVAATGVFSRLDGLGALGAGVRDWLGQMAGGAGDPWHGFVLPLLVYAPLVAVFGLGGALLAPRRAGNVGLFLQVWTLLALSIGAASGQPDLVAHAALPLTLSAALALTRWAEAMRTGFRWGDDGVTAAIVLMVVAYGLASAAVFTGAATPEDGSGDWQRAWLSWVMAGGLMALYGAVWGPALAGRVLGLTAVIVLGGLGWANGARLNYVAGLDVRELLRPEYVTSSAGELDRALDDGGAMAGDAEAAGPDGNGQRIVVDPALAPALAWTLREHAAVEWRASAAEAGAVLVQPSGVVPITPGGGARRSFPVAAVWSPDFAGRLAFLRWYLHRRPAVSVNPAADGPAFVRVDVVEDGES